MDLKAFAKNLDFKELTVNPPGPPSHTVNALFTFVARMSESREAEPARLESSVPFSLPKH